MKRRYLWRTKAAPDTGELALTSKSWCSPAGHKGCHRIPAWDKAALKSWPKRTRQNHVSVMSEHRQMYEHCPCQENGQTPPMLADMDAYCFFANHTLAPPYSSLLIVRKYQAAWSHHLLQHPVEGSFLKSSPSTHNTAHILSPMGPPLPEMPIFPQLCIHFTITRTKSSLLYVLLPSWTDIVELRTK
jgi:hypothetical protein